MASRLRRRNAGNDTDSEPLLTYEVSECESEQTIESTHFDDTEECEDLNELRLSSDPKQECRLILLGSDDIAKNEACRILLRTSHIQERTNLGRCELKENFVRGRHVSVVKSPSYWLEHLTSYWIFSNGVKAIKNEMQHCVSLVFPGPHAFLLVIRNGKATNKEHELLNAITSVFGKEALDYSMVLLIPSANSAHLGQERLKCVLECGGRQHLLKNNDDSVNKLFTTIENMVSKKTDKFFVPLAYEHFMKINFNMWEKTRIGIAIEDKRNLEEKLKKIQTINQDLKLKIKDEKTKLMTELNTSSQLKKELDASRVKESELKKELNDSKVKESELKKELNASRVKESELKKELNASRVKESELKKELNASRVKESELKKELDASRVKESELKKELNASRVKESELKKELNASRVNKGELKELNTYQQTENESSKNRGTEMEPDPQATGTKRRRSKELLQPYFSTEQPENLD